jgi:membrane fusion protein, multidrug efflux system
MHSFRARRICTLFLVFICLLIINISLVGCQGEKSGDKGPAITEVTAIVVEQKNTPVTFEYVAQTESSHLVQIRARVDGFLDRVAYSEGSIVKKGQILFKIDPKPFEANLEEAKAVLVEQEASWLNAKTNLERIKPLSIKNAVSKKDLDDAIGLERSTAGAFLAAKAKVRQAELNLGYCTIYSPIDGISSWAKKQEGSYISAGEDSLLTTVSQLDPIWVTFSISENEYLNLVDREKEGSMIVPAYNRMSVNLALSNGKKYPGKGRLIFTEPSFSQETGTFLARAEFPNPAGLLKPGQFVKLLLGGVIRPKAVVVPRTALNQGAKGYFVWVIKPDMSVEYRDVDEGEWVGECQFILKGLKPGEQIVLGGGLKLSSGMKVKVKKYISDREPAPSGGDSNRPAAGQN